MRTVLIALLTCSLPLWAANYSNPVLPGDYPDPSVIRIGKEYWATATKSHWAPIFPLLRSTDLIHWTQAGAVFQQAPEWSAGSYWAPEISTHKGRYFVYYTARKKDGPLCVAVASASKPNGPYEDHGPMVCQDAGSIDAVATDDENGQRYLLWKEDGNSRKQPTPLWAQPLSDDGTKLVGEPKEILRNDVPWEGAVVEGPFVLRRDGWFYLFYSGAGCCGLRCNYALGVARWRKLLGPWEKNPANPILAENDRWKCPGHGSLVDDGRGRTFLLYHAYERTASIWVGRQGLLDEVTWGKDGWPLITRANSTKGQQPRLEPQLEWPYNQKATVRVAGAAVTIESESEAVAAKAPQVMNYIATTVVRLRDGTAGLAAYGDRNNATGLTVSGGKLTLWRRTKGEQSTLKEMDAPRGPVHFRMSADAGRKFTFSFSPDGMTWTVIAPGVDGTTLPPWDLATRIALVANGKASFDYLRVVNR